jgi:Holliday junction resolvase RusA-like endonuclease
MTSELNFRVRGAPQGKGRARSSGRHHYTPAVTREYEQRVRATFRAAYPNHQTIPKGVPVTLFIVAESVKAPTSRLQAPTSTPDWDNIGKAVSDALNGIAWHDDSQVTDGRVIKRFADHEGVEVLIEW